MSFRGAGRGHCVWAQKRGELFYASGGLIVQEKILNSKQRFIHTDKIDGNIMTLALSADETKLAFSVWNGSEKGPNLVLVDLQNDNQLTHIPVKTESNIYLLDFSDDNRWLVSVSGEFETLVEVHSTFNGFAAAEPGAFSMIINDLKFVGPGLFLTVGDELRYWEIRTGFYQFPKTPKILWGVYKRCIKYTSAYGCENGV